MSVHREALHKKSAERLGYAKLPLHLLSTVTKFNLIGCERIGTTDGGGARAQKSARSGRSLPPCYDTRFPRPAAATCHMVWNQLDGNFVATANLQPRMHTLLCTLPEIVLPDTHVRVSVLIPAGGIATDVVPLEPTLATVWPNYAGAPWLQPISIPNMQALKDLSTQLYFRVLNLVFRLVRVRTTCILKDLIVPRYMYFKAGSFFNE